MLAKKINKWSIATLAVFAVLLLCGFVPYTPDANTILIDHFDGATSANILAYSEDGVVCGQYGGTPKPSAIPIWAYGPGPNGLNQALSLNPPVGEPAGSGTYLQYPGELLSQSNGTIEFWTYLTTGTGVGLVRQGRFPGACDGWTFFMSVSATGQLQASAWAAFSMNSGATTVPLNAWTHVAATWGSAGAKLYINGVLVGSDANTGMPASGYSGSVMINLGGGIGLQIDELRISNLQRSPRWTTKAPMPTARQGAVGGVVNGKLYVAGGTGTDGLALATLEVYDPAIDTWATKAPMLTARGGAGGAVINGKLYVVGGDIAQNQKLATLEVYDPATNAWATGAPMHTPRSGPGAVAIDGKLYVAGGCQGWCAPVTDALEVYDPATNIWTTKTSMPTGRGVTDVAVVNGLFYVMGGCCGGVGSESELMAKTIEVYNPTDNTWTTKTQHLVGAGDTAGSINGMIYVAKPTATEVYDPVTDTWAPLTPMTVARTYAAGGVINGKLYVAGGGRFDGTAAGTAALETFTPGMHNASGTYTWNATTGVQTAIWTSSDFVCDGPGSTTNKTGVIITSTTMTADGGDTWTRPGGTADDIVGTWTSTNGTTGNSFELTFNADLTVSVTGVIVSCGGGTTISFNGWVKTSPNWPSTDGMAAISGATVNALPGTGPSPFASDVTNTDGSFSITGIPASSIFRLVVPTPESTTYVPVLSKFINWNADIQALLPFVLFTQDQYTNILQNPAGTGMILGRVALKNSPATFLSGATVVATQWLNGAPTGTTYPVTCTGGGAVTGADGIYMVKNIPAGELVQLVATLPNQTFEFNDAVVPTQPGFITEESFFATGFQPTPFKVYSYHQDTSYFINMFVDDPSQAFTGVTVNGPDLTGEVSLEYITAKLRWELPVGVGISLGTTLPTEARTYNFTAATGGTPVTGSRTVSVYVEGFATGLSPTGNVNAAQPTFSWTGFAAATSYSVILEDQTASNWGFWSGPNLGPGPGQMSAVYDGPSLISGHTYQYTVIASINTDGNDNASFARATFTYTGTTPDEAAIRGSFDGLVTEFNKGAAGNISVMMSHFSTNYMDNGRNYAAQQADMQQGLSQVPFQPLPQPVSVTVTVTGATATAVINWIGSDVETLKWAKEGDGVWRIIGNGNPYNSPWAGTHHNQDGQYYGDFVVSDPNHILQSVAVTGDGISGTLYLTYRPDAGAWWATPNQIHYGANPPVNAQYQIVVTGPAGTYTYTRTINGGVTDFATALTPTGNVSGALTFTFTGIGGANYAVHLFDANMLHLWMSPTSSSTTVTYTGPPLSAGTYNYLVHSFIDNNSSIAQRQFTYGLYYTPMVFNVHSSDGYHTYLDITIGNSFTGTLPDAISAINVTGPGETVIATKQNLQYYPEFREFLVKMPGQPVLGQYRFEITGLSQTTTGTDTQSVNRNIPMPDKSTFVYTPGATPTFSWGAVDYTETPRYYRLIINDMAGNRVYSSSRVQGMLSHTVPTGILQTDQSYQFQVRVEDASTGNAVQNQSRSDYETFPRTAISYTYQVKTAAGAPLAGVTVSVDGNPNPDPSALTDADGMFTLTGLTARSNFYAKMVKEDYRATYSARLSSQNNMTWDGRSYTLYTAADTANWPVNFAEKGALASWVADSSSNAISGAVVTAASNLHPTVSYVVTYVDSAGNFGGSATSGNGRYRVWNVDEGDIVTVTAVKSGMTFNTRTFLAHAGGIGQGKVTGTATAGTITFTGTVTAGGQKAADVTVQMAGNAGVSTQTASDGSYTLTGLPINTTFSLGYTKEGYVPLYSRNRSSGGNIAASRSNSLFTQADLNAWGAASGGVINGRVADGANPTTVFIAGATVSYASANAYTVYYADDNWNIVSGATSTQGGGRYLLIPNGAPVEGNTVTVTAAKAGWTFPTHTFVTHVGAVSQGGIDGQIVTADETAIRNSFAAAVTAYNAKDVTILMSYFSTNYLDSGRNRDAMQAQFNQSIVNNPNWMPRPTSFTMATTVSGATAASIVSWPDGTREKQFFIKEGSSWKIYGNQEKYEAKGGSGHIGNNYYGAIQVLDPGHAIQSVRITGTNLSEALDLSWSSAQGGIWDAWQFINYGQSPPDNAVYDVQIVDAAGTYTYQRVINGGVTGFPANLAPTGSVSGNIVFTFTAAQGAAAYTVQIYPQGQPSNVFWFVHGVPGTTISYAGSALAPGVSYGYDVVAEFQTENGRNSSAASAQFTYTEIPYTPISYTGYVADSQSPSQIVVGATVEQGGVSTNFATTDATGMYTLGDLKAGLPFYIKISKDASYAPCYSAEMTYTANRIDPRDRAFTLFPASRLGPGTGNWNVDAGKGIIRAYVRDKIDGYVGGAVVTATGVLQATYPVCYDDVCTPSLTVTKDKDGAGRFVIKNVLDGDTVTVTATKAGWTFNTRIYHTFAGGVSQGRLTGQGPVSLALTVTMSGPAWTPIQGALVQVMGFPSVSALTGADGKTTLMGLPPSTNIPFMISKEGYVNGYGMFSATGVSTWSVPLYTQTDLNTWGVRVGAGVIYGRVSNNADSNNATNALAGAQVTCTSDQGKAYEVVYLNDDYTVAAGATTTLANGRYLVVNVAPGDEVTVSARKEGWSFWSKTTIGYAGGVSHDYIHGNAGGATISMYVKDKNSAPIAGATVRMAENPSLFATSDLSGKATLANLPLDTPLTFEVMKTGYANTYSRHVILTGNNSDWGTYYLFPSVNAVWGVLDGKGAVMGWVKKETDGSTLAGAQVTCFSARGRKYAVAYLNSDHSIAVGAVATSSNGRFLILNVEPGDTVVVTAHLAGWTFQPRAYTARANAVNQSNINGRQYKYQGTARLLHGMAPTNYLAYLRVDDPLAAIGSITVTGPGIASPISLTYDSQKQSWQNEGAIGFVAMPSLPLTYTLVITEQGVTTPLKQYLYVSSTTGIRGDVNGDGVVNLTDALLSLQASIGNLPAGVTVYTDADVDGDNRIGLQEAVYILQTVSGLR